MMKFLPKKGCFFLYRKLLFKERNHICIIAFLRIFPDKDTIQWKKGSFIQPKKLKDENTVKTINEIHKNGCLLAKHAFTILKSA